MDGLRIYLYVARTRGTGKRLRWDKTRSWLWKFEVLFFILRRFLFFLPLVYFNYCFFWIPFLRFFFQSTYLQITLFLTIILESCFDRLWFWTWHGNFIFIFYHFSFVLYWFYVKVVSSIFFILLYFVLIWFLFQYFRLGLC